MGEESQQVLACIHRSPENPDGDGCINIHFDGKIYIAGGNARAPPGRGGLRTLCARLLLRCVSMSAAPGSPTPASEPSEIRRVSVAEARALAASGRAVLVDTREDRKSVV